MSDNESEAPKEFPKTGLDSSDSDLSNDEINGKMDTNEETTNDFENNQTKNRPNLFGNSSDEDEQEEIQQQEQQIVDHNELDENETAMKDESSDDDSEANNSEVGNKENLAPEVNSDEKTAKNVFMDENEDMNDHPDSSFLPMSPEYNEDRYLQEHESRQLNQSTGKRRVELNSDDSDDEQPTKRPHQQLDDDDDEIHDPFAEPLNGETQQKEDDGDTSDPDKPQAGKPTEEDDPSISDFDKAMARRKKAMKRARKSRGDSTFISEADDLINDLMRQMSEASNLDKEASQAGIPAIHKLKLLNKLDAAFKVKDYHESFIDNGVMTAIADWLTLLPNKSLPNLQIRTSLLNTLIDFPECSIETLKASGVGKAVNILLQHPKELQDNKRKCKKLVRRYSKLIFGVVDTGAISKEERKERDMESLRRYGGHRKTKYQKLREQQAEEQSKKKIYDKGFMPRARVPLPSNRDYLIRPKDNIEPDAYPTVKSSSKKLRTGNEALMDKTKKRLDRNRVKKSIPKAAKVSLSGGKGCL